MNEFILQHPILSLVLVAAGVKHAAYILINGSIFEPLRNAIQMRARRRDNTFWVKMADLFSCMLCMTMQVSLWTVGLSSLALGLQAHALEEFVGLNLAAGEEILLTGLVAFLLSAAVASLAHGYYSVLEHRPKKFRALQAEHQKELDRQRQVFLEAAQNGGGSSQGGSAEAVALAALTTERMEGFLRLLREDCMSLGCPVKREACFRRIAGEKATNWASDPTSHEVLFGALLRTAWEYEAEGWLTAAQLGEQAMLTQLIEFARRELATT